MADLGSYPGPADELHLSCFCGDVQGSSGWGEDANSSDGSGALCLADICFFVLETIRTGAMRVVHITVKTAH